jgi:hypothetical protein
LSPLSLKDPLKISLFNYTPSHYDKYLPLPLFNVVIAPFLEEKEKEMKNF